MKEKKAGRIIILIILTFICFLRVIWIFGKNYFNNDDYEKRELTKKPKLTLQNYANFSNDYTEYFNDHFPFRNQFVFLNSFIDYYCFNKSSNDSVIVGKDNWLFYSRKDDGDPIASYQGKDLLSDTELEAIKNNCLRQKEFAQSQGKEFVIFIAPNKERIYFEYMPSTYGLPAENYAALQIYNYLKDNTDIRIVYPYNELIEAKNRLKENIWYKSDSHWNYIGGYIGASALLDELGINMPKVYDKDIHINALGPSSGDLADLLNLSNELNSFDREYYLVGYDLHDCVEIESDFDGMIHFRAQNADTRSIYVIRDSFSTHMASYIGSQFNDSYLRHNNTYKYEDYVLHDPDIVVYETVERYAKRLAYFSLY